MTFLEDGTPVRSVKAEDGEGDSHDLSISPRGGGRDSLVDNMLLSLDRFAGAGAPSIASGDGSLDAASMHSPPKFGRPRGHTQSSSHSSDFDLRPHDVSSRYSTHVVRGRRSNSSSNFQAVLERIDSLRGTEKARGKLPEAERAEDPVPKLSTMQAKGHSTRASVDSGGSGLDYGPNPLTSAPRFVPSTEFRSSSLDLGHRGRTLQTSQSDVFANILDEDRQAAAAAYNSYDAAPMPNVPIGPRRQQSPVRQSMLPTLPVDLAPQIPPKEERWNRKSTRSIYNRSDKVISYADPAGLRDLPPLPPFDDPAAPSPSISFGKIPKSLAAPARDRPGFFRRVFGSSKNTPANHGFASKQVPSPEAPPSVIQERTVSRGKLNHIADQMKTSPPPTAAGKPTVLQKDQPPTLNKKTSFFRRRKKSVAESSPPPVPVPAPVQAPQTQTLAATGADPADATLSPTSSLRKVMNPYLRGSSNARESLLDGRLQPGSPCDRGLRGSYSCVALSTQEKAKSSRTPRRESQDKTVRTTQQGSDSFPRQEKEKTSPGLSAVAATAQDNAEEAVPEKSGTSKGIVLADALAHPSQNEQVVEQKNVAVAPGSTQGKPVETDVPTLEQPSAASVRQTKLTEEVAPAPTPAPAIQASGSKDSQSKSAAHEDPFPGELEECLPPPVPKSVSGPATEADAEDEKPVFHKPSYSDGPTPHEAIASKPVDQSRESLLVSPSTSSDYKSASSLPYVPIEDEGTEVPSATETETEVPAPLPVDENEPTAEDRGKVKQIFEGNEEFVSKSTAAAWLGESGPASARARRAYMELFDWTNLSILAAMRALCASLILKGETQQVDRILDAVSRRWCQCNSNHAFKATDVVHTICYSILLLNTDIYLADIEQKMTRNQYVRNTMPTIRRVAADAAPDSFEPPRSGSVACHAQTPLTEPNSPALQASTPVKERPSAEMERPSRRASRRPSATDEATNRAPTPSDADPSTDDCGPLVKAPFVGPIKAWEAQVELVLKNFYNSIRVQRLPLHGSTDERVPDQAGPSSLSALTGSMLRRSPSMMSRAPSENPSHRGRPEMNRGNTSRWSSKTRSRPRLYPRSAVGSSRTSLDDEASLWSPTGSNTWSKYSLGKTLTSMSVESFSSSFPQGDYQQSVGFANALSQAIIREETPDTTVPHDRIAPLLEDETLGLVGAPWAKEGILKHKHHLVSVDKKANHRNWSECFAVIEKGWMRLFSFSAKSSLRNRNKSRQPSGGVVGGGNWSENAEALGTFLLRQTIASALPPPGYSKTRPHVWALSLPTGAVHLFQVGTADIVKEFVSTANYWSARLSKEPMVGGISNIEYGWGNLVINDAQTNSDHSRPPTSSGRRPSLQSSIRSSMDHGSMSRVKLPGDRITVSDWAPPQQSMVASNLMEVDQLNVST